MFLFGDTFDHYATADLTAKWTSVVGSPTVDASSGRRGTNSLRRTGGGTIAVTKTLVPGDATFVCGFAWKQDSSPIYYCLVNVLDGATEQMSLSVQLTSMQLVVTRGSYNGTVLGTSTFALSTATYYYIEFKTLISNTVGTYEVRVNGVNVLSGSGVDTQATAASQWTGFQMRPYTLGSSIITNVDDLYILDGVASADPTYPDNNFLGDVAGYYLPPTAEGVTIEWTPSAGTDNAANVDETTPDTTDYNSATATEKDTLTMPDVPVAGAVILAYQTVLYAEKTDAGACTIAPVIRSVGTDYVGTAVSPSNGAYAYFLQPYSVDPATSLVPTEANWNAGEMGYKRVT